MSGFMGRRWLGCGFVLAMGLGSGWVAGLNARGLSCVPHSIEECGTISCRMGNLLGYGGKNGKLFFCRYVRGSEAVFCFIILPIQVVEPLID